MTEGLLFSYDPSGSRKLPLSLSPYPEEASATNQKSNPMVELFRAAIGKKLEGAPPLTKWLDGRIVSCDVGEMEVRFTTRPEMANPAGLLHGGIQAAIMDDVIGMTSATVEDEGFMLSIDLHVNYLGKIKVGESVLARARLVRSGKRVAHAVCELMDAQGEVVSRCDANLIRAPVGGNRGVRRRDPKGQRRKRYRSRAWVLGADPRLRIGFVQDGWVGAQGRAVWRADRKLSICFPGRAQVVRCRAAV